MTMVWACGVASADSQGRDAEPLLASVVDEIVDYLMAQDDPRDIADRLDMSVEQGIATGRPVAAVNAATIRAAFLQRVSCLIQ